MWRLSSTNTAASPDWPGDDRAAAPTGLAACTLAPKSLGTMMRRVARALEVARQQALETGQPVLWISHAGVAQCAHWLLTRGDRLPLAKDWPSVKLAYGEWLRLPLLSNS